jgi:benzoylformate decarboxylase
VVGDVKASLVALLPLVRDRVDAARAAVAVEAAGRAREAALARAEKVAAERRLDLPMHPVAAVHAVVRALPGPGVLVDESMSSSFHVRDLFLSDRPGSYYFAAAGGLGWAVPAAVGIKLARPDVPVLCLVGDGAAMYTIQALWTAAHQQIPIVVCVLNNRQYAILKGPLAGMGGKSAALGTYVGMDMVDPPVDFVAVARGLGVDAGVVEKASDVTDAVRAALQSGRPCLLDLPVSPPDIPSPVPTPEPSEREG